MGNTVAFVNKEKILSYIEGPDLHSLLLAYEETESIAELIETNYPAYEKMLRLYVMNPYSASRVEELVRRYEHPWSSTMTFSNFLDRIVHHVFGLALHEAMERK